ncbi:cryptochrome/photolyase family protein [Aestuariivirga sp.]|jgi:deoxyribodipyrimidine photolyase-related protein|uniref:cryptochrome/photolyase family protein n=1 Tax=Aestuariivirga sp. TaxID=2650926 RepID=UPI0037851F74
MSTLRIVLGDQLTRGLSSLRDHAPGDTVLMMEVAEEATYVKHHKQKLTLIFSAMRHFAAELEADGISVDYVRLDDPANTGSLTTELRRAVIRHRPSSIIVTEPGEWRVREMMKGWGAEIRDDDRFLASPASFAAWAKGRKQLRMEFFYRDMRRLSGFLMDGDEPTGGQWNFDHDNRKSLPRGVTPPKRLRFDPDPVTREVMDMVEARFPDHFGELAPFGWAVTRDDALEALDHFITACLPQFGDYQDAMKQGNGFLYHSIISPYLNIGLITAREVCARAEQAWKQGRAPLNAVEGFIRQILGWREYVRGLYWLKMPDYAATNALDARRPLPDFYWTGETEMNCLRQAIGETKRHAYAHHIQRLMVTGNFALLAGLEPQAVEEWYLLVYADAFEWVELPNTHGMALYADGGVMASKPYAASGAYINRMSDYCSGCAYDPAEKLGPKACPFNYLYWDFLLRNEKRLSGNPRMAMPYRTLAKMEAGRKREIATAAELFLDGLSQSTGRA